MKFLFAGLKEYREESNVEFLRMQGQTAGVAQLGNEAAYTFLRENTLVFRSNEKEKLYPLPEEGKKRHRLITAGVCAIMEENHYDYVYLRGDLITREAVKLARFVNEKCFGAKIIFEVVDYKGEDGYKKLIQKMKSKNCKALRKKMKKRLSEHNRCKKKFSRLVDVLVVFGSQVETVWGMPAIGMETGLSISKILPRTHVERLEEPISIFGIAEDAITHGFDRVLRGLQAYRGFSERDEVLFDIAGSEENVAGLKQITSELGLEGKVRFLGECSPEIISQCCMEHTVAVSCLGSYRAGEFCVSPDSSKYYCAAGIPFIYAYDDLFLIEDVPFAMKLPNNDSPINIALISEFVWRCRLNPNLARMERKFAEKNYDWRVIMKRIINFAVTRRWEV